jgi:hypothetical protein
MSVAYLDTASTRRDSEFNIERHDTDLAALTEEMAGLRFSIILAARGESSKILKAENRADLKAELAELRALYSDRLDEIAMRFGIPHALAAKEAVERTVHVPKGARYPLKSRAWV